MRRAIDLARRFWRDDLRTCRTASRLGVDSNHVRANDDCATHDQEFRRNLLGDLYLRLDLVNNAFAID
jgi:hypothetical protein